MRIPMIKIRTNDKRKYTGSAEGWHEDFIVHLASVLKPRVYVELGLYQSALFNRVCEFAQKSIGVDIDKDLVKYMKKNKNNIFLGTTTMEALEYLKKKKIKIDMLFIDADHSAQSVKEDFEAYFPFVADQGIILLHDGYPKNKKYTDRGYCGDAYKAISKMTVARKGCEMVTIPMHPGLTICRKYKDFLPWQKNEK